MQTMSGTRRVLTTLAVAVAVLQPFRPWFSPFPEGKISQERPQAARHECVTRAGPIAPKLPILRGSLLARPPSIVRRARFREGAKSGGESGLPL